FKIKAFPLILGENDGQKMRRGDKKTPEGTYWVMDMFPGKVMGKIYGSLIFPLNYPNKRDRAKGKTGSGIWIHGAEPGNLMEPTRGCIKLANIYLLELLHFIELPTPIIIQSESDKTIDFSMSELNWIEEEYYEIKNNIRGHSRRLGLFYSKQKLREIGENYPKFSKSRSNSR
ncbi:MAG: L,D-transpeptidase family protein, partial [Fibrobacteria bacterium]|nr:L,D-transpeptidase family protein [Fibrobacteria bacterium]